MKQQVARLTLFGVAFLLGGAGAAFACPPDEEEIAMACADYISSGEDDEPLTGVLLGTQTVKETTTVNAGGEVSVGGGKLPVGGSTSTGLTTTVEITYEVGSYRMSDKQTITIDCRDYTIR